MLDAKRSGFVFIRGEGCCYYFEHRSVHYSFPIISSLKISGKCSKKGNGGFVAVQLISYYLIVIFQVVNFILLNSNATAVKYKLVI